MFLGNDPLAFRKLNEQNTQFWLEQSKLTAERMTDEIMSSFAIDILQSEYTRGVPIYSQQPIDKILNDLAMFKKSFHKDFSQKGGRGSKPDALQEVILEIVAKNPKITTVQLEEALKEKKCEDDIDIDSNEDLLAGDQRQIHYEDDDGNEKTSYLSGLKDRLYRARKTLGSRKPVSAK